MAAVDFKAFIEPKILGEKQEALEQNITLDDADRLIRLDSYGAPLKQEHSTAELPQQTQGQG